jgi:serine phosphatase RsbU (regulator of sigma subunit)
MLSCLMIAFFFASYAQQQTRLLDSEQALNTALKNRDNGKAAYYSYEIAKVHIEQKQHDKAIEFFNQCITYAKKTSDLTLTCLAYQQLATVYGTKKDYSKSLDNYQKSLKLAEELKKTDLETELLLQIATSQAQLGRYKKAVEPAEKALSTAIQRNDVLLQQKCYELLEGFYSKLGNTSKANEYKNLNSNIIKSKQLEVQSEQTAQKQKKLEQQIKRVTVEKKTVDTQLNQQAQKLQHTEDSLLATKYSLEATASSLQHEKELNEKRQLEIDLLNKDKELTQLQIKEQDARLKNEALIRNSIIFGIVLLLILAAVLVNGYRKTLAANKKIDQQNESIKSSINYAKRIQEAMLPKSESQKDLIPDSFILFKPRDSVSGDFYWFKEIKSWYNPDVVFAAVDCTGHGVPGAFMSMIGINALNGIITRGVAETNQILDSLDAEIRTALQQETSGNVDGMDIALCIHRKEKNIVEFSGAKNPLVYIQNKKLFQVKGDVHSIGGSKTKREFSYKKHIVTIDQPTMIYLFTDGYRDQFGGKDNTKFMSKKFSNLLFEIHHLPLAEQKEILNKTIEEWKGTHHQTDDILVMGIKLDTVII